MRAAIMNAFRHVLVPIDFGVPSERALDLALDLAQKEGAKVTLLHAYSLPLLAYGEGIVWPIEEFRQSAQKTLDDALARAKARYPRVEGVLVYGEPREKILEAVDKHGIDLIVMGTHGLRGLSRAFFGSVAERIVRVSPVPVMTVSGTGARAAAAA